MQVTKITVGRLFNLGSYEHVRYELTVEVKDGESARDAMIGCEKILEALNPKRPGNVPTVTDTERERVRLKDMAALEESEFYRLHGGFTGTRLQYLARIEESINEGQKRREQWETKARAARELLGNLGAAHEWTDHKLSWESDYDYQD